MSSPEHAVIVRYSLAGDRFGHETERQAVYALEKELVEAIETAGAGEFDGHEFGGGEVTLYAYGADATRLFAAMERLLKAFPARPASATLRFGDVEDASVVEQRVRL